VKWGLERETGLEPATFSLEGLGVYALWHRAWRPERSVSSYRVVTKRVVTAREAGGTVTAEIPGSGTVRPAALDDGPYRAST
jgi:hypothetical protein